MNAQSFFHHKVLNKVTFSTYSNLAEEDMILTQVEIDDYKHRFGTLSNLYGLDSLDRLSKAHICIVGVGGVGSWCVEALVRSGLRFITLVDSDDICVSNINRQVQALSSTIGKFKVDVLKERIYDINPYANVIVHYDFLTRMNVDSFINTNYQHYDIVIDAVDDVFDKAALINACVNKSIPIITCGAGGGLMDPTLLRVSDLARVTGDNLLMQVRKRLRQKYGYPQGHQKSSRQPSLWCIETIHSLPTGTQTKTLQQEIGASAEFVVSFRESFSSRRVPQFANFCAFEKKEEENSNPSDKKGSQIPKVGVSEIQIPEKFAFLGQKGGAEISIDTRGSGGSEKNSQPDTTVEQSGQNFVQQIIQEEADQLSLDSISIAGSESPTRADSPEEFTEAILDTFNALNNAIAAKPDWTPQKFLALIEQYDNLVQHPSIKDLPQQIQDNLPVMDLLQKIQTTNENLQKQVQHHRKQVEKFQKDKDALYKEIANEKKHANDQDDIILGMHEEQKQMHKELQNYDTKYKEKKQKITDLETIQTTLETDRGLIEARLVELQSERDLDQQQLQQLTQECSQLRANTEAIVTQRLANLQARHDDLATRLHAMATQLALFKTKAEQYDQLKDQMLTEAKQRQATQIVVTTQNIPPLVGDTLRYEEVIKLRDTIFLQLGKSSAQNTHRYKYISARLQTLIDIKFEAYNKLWPEIYHYKNHRDEDDDTFFYLLIKMLENTKGKAQLGIEQRLANITLAYEGDAAAADLYALRVTDEVTHEGFSLNELDPIKQKQWLQILAQNIYRSDVSKSDEERRCEKINREVQTKVLANPKLTIREYLQYGSELLLDIKNEIQQVTQRAREGSTPPRAQNLALGRNAIGKHNMILERTRTLIRESQRAKTIKGGRADHVVHRRDPDQNHPDYNPDDKEFDRSTIGSKYYDKGLYSLNNNEYYDPKTDKIQKRPQVCSCLVCLMHERIHSINFVSATVTDRPLRQTKDTADAHTRSDTDTVEGTQHQVYDVLLDTGALCGNNVNDQTAEYLSSNYQIKTVQESDIVLCTAVNQI
eukprot:gene6111-12375_t